MCVFVRVCQEKVRTQTYMSLFFDDNTVCSLHKITRINRTGKIIVVRSVNFSMTNMMMSYSLLYIYIYMKNMLQFDCKISLHSISESANR